MAASRSQRLTRPLPGDQNKSLDEREVAVAEREILVRRREQSLASKEMALAARGAEALACPEVERLMGQLREANERLIVAAAHAQDVSDEALAEAERARSDLNYLMSRLRDTNELAATAAAHGRAMAAEASARREEYRRLSVRLLQLQDEERRRLAVNLHDVTAQGLAALTMNLDVLANAKHALSAESRRALAESRSLATLCSREVRTLAYLLHPPLLDEAGLVSAVRWFAEGFTKRSGINVTLNLGPVGRLPTAIETALFRVVQESLTNVHRHASSSTASIYLGSTAKQVVLDIQDHGRGLCDHVTEQHDRLGPETLGVGIQGMRERIWQLGGTFDIEFSRTGTTVRVGVPLNTGVP